MIEASEQQQLQNASRIGSLVSSIVQFAMGRAEELIVDKDGNVIWEEAFVALSTSVKDPDNVTLQEIADAIEPYIPQKSVDDLHRIVMQLPLTVRAEITAGSGAARMFLWKKSWKDELINKKQKYILTTVKSAKTIETYNLLATHPNILTLITAYIFKCLGLEYEPVLSTVIEVQPQIALDPNVQG